MRTFRYISTTGRTETGSHFETYHEFLPRTQTWRLRRRRVCLNYILLKLYIFFTVQLRKYHKGFSHNHLLQKYVSKQEINAVFVSSLFASFISNLPIGQVLLVFYLHTQASVSVEHCPCLWFSSLQHHCTIFTPACWKHSTKIFVKYSRPRK